MTSTQIYSCVTITENLENQSIFDEVMNPAETTFYGPPDKDTVEIDNLVLYNVGNLTATHVKVCQFKLSHGNLSQLKSSVAFIPFM